MIAVSLMQKIGKLFEDEIVYDVVHVKKDPKKRATPDNLTEAKKKPDIKIIANNFEKYVF